MFKELFENKDIIEYTVEYMPRDRQSYLEDIEGNIPRVTKYDRAGAVKQKKMIDKNLSASAKKAGFRNVIVRVVNNKYNQK